MFKSYAQKFESGTIYILLYQYINRKKFQLLIDKLAFFKVFAANCKTSPES